MQGTIYKITNSVNQKVYIGNTTQTIERRFKQHISDSKKERCNKRPLYHAMNKYGIDKFTIIEIGKFENSKEIEMKHILEYDSYKNGYNATLGGDGKSYVVESDDIIVSKYKELCSIKMVSDYFGYHEDTISEILKRNDVVLISRIHANRLAVSCPTLEVSFDDIYKMATYLISHQYSSARLSVVVDGIKRAMTGKRKSYLKMQFVEL
ncbi:MAG: GIY-YIG nuclease family protein [Cetobacterium sp.]